MTPGSNSVPSLRALVVEDEAPARSYLIELLHGSGACRVVAAVGNAADAARALTAGGRALDVAFVDVRLLGPPDSESGLDLVRRFADGPEAPAFVLTTAFREHALDAYQLGVVDYLLKPLSEERVAETLRRVSARHPPEPGPVRVAARQRNDIVFLDFDEVWAFEAADRLTFVHGRFGRYDVDLSLGALVTTLGGAFLRVHRNWLINTGHVRALSRDGGELVLVVGRGDGRPDGRNDGDEELRVPVARERAAEVRRVLLATTTGLRRP